MNGSVGEAAGTPRSARKPLYRQVRHVIEEGISLGRFDVHAPLPSTRGLALELGVSRNTVNNAYQELIAEGFIVSRPRSGLFVNEEVFSHVGSGHRPPAAAPDQVRWHQRLRPEHDAGLPEVAKRSDWQSYPYPFIAGQVEARSFPSLAWSRVLREALYEPHLHYSLRDGIAADDPLLVDLLCDRILPGRGIETSPENVMITMGSQEGLQLLSHALLGPASVVAVEEPGYLDARHVFVRAGAELAPHPVDGSGVVPPAHLHGVDLLYLTPSHQHPTNATLSIGRRHHLLALADRDDVIIVEDDYDSELRYQGSPSPALKGLDTSGRVIYLGTFSKFLAPGLRLGFVVADTELISHLRKERRYSIRHPPGHLQRAMALFIASGQYQRSVRRHRISLRRKWEAMCRALEHSVPIPVLTPPGGVSIWVQGPAGLDAVELADTLSRRGVIIERGDVCYTDPASHRNDFRLGFAAIRLDAIDPGMRIVRGPPTTGVEARDHDPGAAVRCGPGPIEGRASRWQRHRREHLLPFL
ncbi:MAG: MocR-like pyridoxine biosynthesis transcription factor PdxR [Acidimicrobiales bacterium]